MAIWWFSSKHLYLLRLLFSFSKNQRFSLKSSLQLIANLLIFSCIRNLFTCQSFLLFPEFDAGSRIIISMRERFLCHFRTLNPFGRISRLSGGWERWKIFEKKIFQTKFWFSSFEWPFLSFQDSNFHWDNLQNVCSIF